jgi:hypothetical protein
MIDKKIAKCAHIPCNCDAAPGQQYCGDACRDAGNEEVEIACQCGHAPCPLTEQAGALPAEQSSNRPVAD